MVFSRSSQIIDIRLVPAQIVELGEPFGGFGQAALERGEAQGLDERLGDRVFKNATRRGHLGKKSNTIVDPEIRTIV
jgi:hypothetical protein